MIDIGSRREFFWDDFLLDTEKTTAQRRLHEPVPREKAFTFDAPWEGNGCGYFHIVDIPDTGIKRMYYNGSRMSTGPDDISRDEVKICCIESRDGLTWTRPRVGLREFEGSFDNNIIIRKQDIPGLRDIDNFFVMYDNNPAPAVKQRFKAVMQYTGDFRPDGRRDRRLITLVSDDGFDFSVFGDVWDFGTFDSLNTVHYNPALGKYVCFFRSLHNRETGAEYDNSREWNEQVRDIRVSFSEDFISWTQPRRIEYSGGEDIAMYTNGVSPCPEAPHMLVGIPTRYTEHPEWTPSFDRLCGSAARRERMKLNKRYGLAITDCAFMCSRDGIHFTRYEEAFLRPGPECPQNWVYGCCYPSVGFIMTPGLFPGSDDEMSIYTKLGHWLPGASTLYRLTLRKDGFASMSAGGEERIIVTKPFIFKGSRLFINFSTSGRGYLKIRLTSEGQSIETCSLFGDSTNREADFDGDVSELAGKPVVMEVRLKDADFYAWRFAE